MRGHIVFKNGSDLLIDFIDSEFVQNWLSMVRSRPLDSLRLMTNVDGDIEKFDILRKLLDELLGTSWSDLPVTQENLNYMHKYLERIPLDQMPPLEHPIHDFHEILHLIEQDWQGKGMKDHGGIRQMSFRSYHNDLIPIPGDFQRSRNLRPGTVYLDYPYVGKTAFVTMATCDDQDLLLTCKPAMHACAGFSISFVDHALDDRAFDTLSDWLDSKGRAIADHYGKENVIRAEHFSIMGSVINLQDFMALRDNFDLKVRCIDF